MVYITYLDHRVSLVVEAVRVLYVLANKVD